MTTHPSWLDLKLGFRLLARYPGLTFIGGISLAFAVAIGAGAFEFIRQLASPTLPLPAGERIVGLRLWDAEASQPEDRAGFDFARWRSGMRSLQDLGAFQPTSANLIVDERAEAIDVAAISASAFRVAGVAPLAGRTLTDVDEQPGAAPVAVIGDDIWQEYFSRHPSAVGRIVGLGNVPTTIVGVMPPGFAFPVSHSVWVPLDSATTLAQPRQGPPIRLFGRLAPGATMAQAQAELAAVGVQTSAALPGTHQHLRPQVLPYTRLFLDLPVTALYAINVFFVVLLALVGANVALLMFARAATRETDIIVRNALGASRSRIVLQLFAEALVLSSMATIAGLVVTRYLLQWWLSVATIEAGGRLPFWLSDRLAPGTYVYAALLTIVGAAIAGGTTALKATRDIEPRLRQAAVGSGLRLGGVWTVVIVAQVAITVLFPAATFFVRRTVVELQVLDPGFPAHEYLSARLQIAQGSSVANVFGELERRLAAEAGVTGVTFTNRLPKTVHPQRRIELDDAVAASAATSVSQLVQTAAVAVNYFDVLGAQPIAGRAFQPGDLPASGESPIVVVNQSFVRTVMNGANPVGRRIRYLGRRGQSQELLRGPWFEIAGLVPDLGTVHDDPADLTAVYHAVRPGEITPAYLVVRLASPPDALASTVRATAAAADPALQLLEVRRLDDAGQTMWTEFDFLSRLLTLISVMAMVLSLAGIYAALSFTVARRTREIGVRLALGARPLRVVLTMFQRSFAQVGTGIACGAVLVLGLTSVVMPEGLSVANAAAVGAYAVAIMATCLIACIVPARRALRVPPTTALRADG